MSVKSSTISETEILAALTLERARASDGRKHAALTRELGSCERTLQRLGWGRGASFDRARIELDAMRRGGIEALPITDDRYPRLLKLVPDPPLVLAVRGSLEPDDAVSLAVVGSRRATRYGMEMAAQLARELSATGITIVSGLARGIDSAAHRGALETRGRTVAVLGSGLANVYPREHHRLAEQIAENGAVLSEFEATEPPRARNFPRRNRIITGMTLGTIVVEAALKSGSLVSARHALDQDREVFAVPGPARSENSAGVHALIRDGATLVSHARDVIEELRPEIQALLRPGHGGTATENEAEALDLTEDERSVVTELRRAQVAMEVDDILEHVGLSTELALSVLSGLELKGCIWRLASGLYQARPPGQR